MALDNQLVDIPNILPLFPFYKCDNPGLGGQLKLSGNISHLEYNPVVYTHCQ